MFNGTVGKYAQICTDARLKANADGAVLIILNGTRGDGFDVHAERSLLMMIPEMLQDILDQIKAQQIKEGLRKPKGNS